MPILPTRRHPKFGEVHRFHLLSSYSSSPQDLAAAGVCLATEHTYFGQGGILVQAPHVLLNADCSPKLHTPFSF